MSERVYQQKMLNSSSRIVLCDWGRGKGKDYAIAESIFSHKDVKHTRVLVFTHDVQNTTNMLRENLGNIIRNGRIAGKGYDMLSILADNGLPLCTVNVFNVATIGNSTMGYKPDYVYFSEDIPNKEQMGWIEQSHNLKKTYIVGTFNFDYITDKPTIEDVESKSWIDSEIDKLMVEFSNVPNQENTTKTRAMILQMIVDLNNLKNK